MELKEEIRLTIANILEISVDRLGYETEMDEIAEWDSMHNILILSELEEKYDVLFPEDDIFDLVSVNAFAEEISKLKA
jgi:acyl carrier protein